MSLPTTPNAFIDCYEVMDKALDDPFGVRVPCHDIDAAIFLRMRCHQARAVDRKQNAATYEKGDPKHGQSAYDKLTLRIRSNGQGIFLYFERSDVEVEGVERLSEVNDLLIEHEPQKAEPVKMIEGPAIRRRV